MSMPMTQNGAQPGDGRELAALLAIGPDARARVRILVVDDEHTLRESCAGVLRHEGYDVTVCSRGQDALDLLKRRAFDVVLVDLYMTQVDGLALLRAALGTNHDTIVIVMTGNPSVESSVEALRQGAFDYLPKPFSASHLQVLIGRLGATEFAVLAPGTDAEGARRLAERLASSVAAATIAPAGAPPAVRMRCGYEAVANVGYAPIEPVDLLVRAAAAVRTGKVDSATWLRRFDEAATPPSSPA